MKDKVRIGGMVTASVFSLDKKGVAGISKLKEQFPDYKSKPLAYCQGRDQIIKEHGYLKQRSQHWNIVTDQGDAIIADTMSESLAERKVDNTNGHIEVGTGFVAAEKSATACVTATGTPEVMDATYPKVKGAFGAANDNVTQYRATFEAGDLSANGIDEAALLDAITVATANCFAYAAFTTSLNVTAADTLQVDWEMTYLGS
jgi:hypothetical protein